MNIDTNFDAKKGVFISYNRASGSKAARQIFEALRSTDFNIFLDEEELGSGRFTEVILNQIGLREHFIIVITPETIDILCNVESWPHRELSRALELKKNVIPILVNGTPVIAEGNKNIILSELGKLNQLKISPDFFDEAMSTLCSKFLQQPTLQELEIKIGEEHYEEAYKAFENEEWEKVIEEMSKGIKIRPDRPDYYLMRGVARHRLDKNEEAISDLDAALTFDPSSFELANAKFQVLQHMDKMREAIDFFANWKRMYMENPDEGHSYWNE
jgi:tetratricopeptide (TPR) repeat protein